MVKEKSSMPLLAIVAIVAVVAVVIVVLQGRTPSSEEAVAGEGFGQISRPIRSCPTCPPTLKDYEIRIDKFPSFEVPGDLRVAFTVNGEMGVFRIYTGANNTYHFANGATVRLDEYYSHSATPPSDVVDWNLMGACSSDYGFTIEFGPDDEIAGNRNAYSNFTIVSVNRRLSPVSQQEVFTLNEGEAKVLRDNSKIILRDVVVHRDYFGPLGVFFELICS